MRKASLSLVRFQVHLETEPFPEWHLDLGIVCDGVLVEVFSVCQDGRGVTSLVTKDKTFIPKDFVREIEEYGRSIGMDIGGVTERLVEFDSTIGRRVFGDKEPVCTNG